MNINYRQVTFAREYRGLSQTKLSLSIKGLSQSNLSKFEKGLGSISKPSLINIVEYLNFPEEFFGKSIPNIIDDAHYRKRTTVKKSDITQFELKCCLIGYIIDEMSLSIEWPEFNLQPLNVEDGYSPETAAKYTRQYLGLNSNEPVKDIISLLEKNGIIVIELEANEKFDGISFISKKGVPVIIINKKHSNDRKRFTLAHELGHIILHEAGDFPISDFRDLKIREKEATRFGTEFLMPENAIKNSLIKLKLSDLSGLKNYWLTSMSSIISRAFNIGCIDKNKYTYFNIEFSRRGLKKNEGFDVYIDESKLFEKGYLLHRNELEYTDEELAKAFSLPIDIIKDIFDFRKSSKLRVVV